MDDRSLRLECLKLAVGIAKPGSTVDELVRMADCFLDYVQGQEDAANPLLAREVGDLELTVHTAVGLRRAGISRIGELIQHTENEMLQIQDINRRCLNEIKDALASKGLSLKA